MRRLGVLLAGLLLAAGTALASPTAAAGVHREPAWARHLPARTSQVVRTVSSHHWCHQVYCSVTQAWRRDATGTWHQVRQFRSTIAARGWGKRHEGDDRSPGGVFRIKTTFTTGRSNPGHMRWRRRRPTSIVSATAGRNYNTWLEVPGVTSGDRPSMRFGWVVDYNHVRLHPGVGPAPVQGKGSGIFYHTSRPGHPWMPTAGCTQVGNPAAMRWLLLWLRPQAHPRVVQNR
jgi:L,D-peptidoglycan transpeptidase YkuD (ErfK/YbiS/YcfS/YnhG family)